MLHVPRGAPFSERGGRLRGVLDLVAGRYPPFLFGLGVGPVLPVFHFHETTVEKLEPAFRYLAENGYRTVGADALSALVHRGQRPPERSVMLAFDDALASLWLVVGPLLKRHGLTAITYAIPGRIAEAAAVRPTIDDGPVDAAAADSAPNPFATWPELVALSRSGIVDVQSHTWSHSMVCCVDRADGVVMPGDDERTMNLPRLGTSDPPRYLTASRLGYPLFPRRSRMSDALRYLPDEAACEAVEQFVTDHGGIEFFQRAEWQAKLQPGLDAIAGQWESDADRLAAIEHEVVAARDTLEARLGTRVRHMCLPWGVSGNITRSVLERLGFETAFANRFSGGFAVKAGDDAFFLKRLEQRHLFALPGRGRRVFTTFA